MNEDMKAKIRKYKKNLVITGYGFIVIEFWSLIKFAIRIIEEGGFRGLMGERADSPYYWVMFYLIFSAFFILITFLHLYIGLCSARYGADKSRNWGFIVAAVLYTGFTVYELPDLVNDCIKAYTSSEPITTADTTFASILLELTILFILIDMISSAFMLMRAEKRSV